MLKKVLAIMGAALLSAIVAGAGEITLRLSTNHTEDFVTGRAVAKFSDLVKQRTNGQIQIECYYNAVLGEEKAVAEQIQFGGIDLIRVSTSVMSEFLGDFNAIQMPFIYADAAHYWRVLDSDRIGMSIMRSEELKKSGFYGLCYYDGGSRSFFFREKSVRSPDDMANLTIRVQESSLMIGLIRTLGANPTAMPSSDVYGALQTGVIDGAENNLPFYLSQSYNEVAAKITLDEHTRAPDALFIGVAAMKKLTPEQIKIIADCALESSRWQRDEWAKSEIESKKRCLDLGCAIIELSPAEKARFMDMVKPFNEKEGAKYKTILDAIAALR